MTYLLYDSCIYKYIQCQSDEFYTKPLNKTQREKPGIWFQSRIFGYLEVHYLDSFSACSLLSRGSLKNYCKVTLLRDWLLACISMCQPCSEQRIIQQECVSRRASAVKPLFCSVHLPGLFLYRHTKRFFQWFLCMHDSRTLFHFSELQ